jgi:hypothetical protein
MAFDSHSYSQLGGSDVQPYGRPIPSIRTTSFVSNDNVELESFTNDSDQRRLLSKSSVPFIDALPPDFLDRPSLDFAKSGTGLWKNQMLVDRSIRGMALLTSFFAISMLIIVVVWIPDYMRNENGESTSVFAAEETCKSASTKNLVCFKVSARMQLMINLNRLSILSSILLPQLY